MATDYNTNGGASCNVEGEFFAVRCRAKYDRTDAWDPVFSDESHPCRNVLRAAVAESVNAQSVNLCAILSGIPNNCDRFVLSIQEGIFIANMVTV